MVEDNADDQPAKGRWVNRGFGPNFALSEPAIM